MPSIIELQTELEIARKDNRALIEALEKSRLRAQASRESSDATFRAGVIWANRCKAFEEEIALLRNSREAASVHTEANNRVKAENEALIKEDARLRAIVQKRDDRIDELSLENDNLRKELSAIYDAARDLCQLVERCTLKDDWRGWNVVGKIQWLRRFIEERLL